MATVEVPLSQGKVAIIDRDDFELVSRFNWYAWQNKGRFYAQSGSRIPGTQAKYRMHRLILGVTDPQTLVDHRDGNGLNNTRENLRIATALENCLNQGKGKGVSRFKGVFPMRGRRLKRWASRIKANGRRIYLGYFMTEEEAAAAYDCAALQYFGEFARVNFPITSKA